MIVTEAQIRRPFLANVRFLRGYRDRARKPALERCLVDALVRLGTATPEMLLALVCRTDAERAEALVPLWRLIAAGEVHADLRVP